MVAEAVAFETPGAQWFAFDITVVPEAVEAIQYALLEAGALGAEERTGVGGETIVTGYFPSVPDREAMRSAFAEALMIYDLPTSVASEMSWREVPHHDWLAEWKRNWQPVQIGRFIIAPPWSELSEVPGQIVIRIEPGMAFGTGTHETTRLCLHAIEEHFQGTSLLDVGTGTGILAIAAAKLFPEAHIEACDTDADAVVIAAENARLNGVENIGFRTGSLDQAASADMVCANLTTDVILPILPELISATCGRLVLSGILREQADAIERRLTELGIEDFAIREDGEWVSIIV
jgi:ribosomal protein L11 methyltransferase